MVEMLGTLAIMGILSVAGLSAFNAAMNKHRSNVLLQEAAKRAVAVSMQINLRGKVGSLAEFTPYNTTSGGTFGDASTENLINQFGIKVSNVKKSVCENVLQGIGTNTPIRRLAPENNITATVTTCKDPEGSYFVVFNNDMNGMSSDIDACEGFEQSLCSTTCANQNGIASYTFAENNTVCGHGKCNAVGGCVCNNGYSGENCDQLDTQDSCSLENPCPTGQYCYYTEFTEHVTDLSVALAGKTGKCKGISATTRYITALGKVRISTNTMNWWSGVLWCQAQGMQMLKLEDLNCYKYNSTEKVTDEITSWSYCCTKKTDCAHDNAWENRKTNPRHSPIFISLVDNLSKAPWLGSYSPADFMFGINIGSGLINGGGGQSEKIIICK